MLKLRLKILFIVIVVFAIAIAWLSVRLEKYYAQQHLIRTVVEAGGTVESQNKGNPLTEEITRISLGGTRLSRKDKSTLGRLSRLEVLSAVGTNIGDHDLKDLTALNSLEKFVLDGTLITDDSAAVLPKLSSLRELSLRFTTISDQTLSYLVRIKSLESVDLNNTLVTTRGLKEFRKRRPDVFVHYWTSAPSPGQLNAMVEFYQCGGYISDAGANYQGPTLSPRYSIGVDGKWRCPGRFAELVRGLAADELIDIGIHDGYPVGLRELGTIDEIHSLSLWIAGPVDEDLHVIRNKGEIRKLHMNCDELGDAGLSVIAQIDSLESLTLVETQVTDNGLTHLARLANLSHLHIEGDNFTDQALEVVEEFRSLETLTITCPNISEVAIESLRKARSEISIETF